MIKRLVHYIMNEGHYEFYCCEEVMVNSQKKVLFDARLFNTNYIIPAHRILSTIEKMKLCYVLRKMYKPSNTLF